MKPVLNKKALQVAAALWILVFHLWMPVTGTQVGQFLVRIGGVGVDIFFFVAAYSLADKKLEPLAFLKDRTIKVYVKFLLFALVAAIYKGWDILRLLKVGTGVEFFLKGGGSFLWFIPAIMLFYIGYVLLKKCTWRYTPLAVLAGWLILTLVLEKCFGYNRLNIVLNRIPAMVLGYVYKKHPLDRRIALLGLPVGLALTYFTWYAARLNTPVYEFYYVMALPLVVGMAGLSAFVKEGTLLRVLGCCTMETYALQMIFGSRLVKFLSQMLPYKLVANLLMVAAVWGAALMLAYGYDYALQGIRWLKGKCRPAVG